MNPEDPDSNIARQPDVSGRPAQTNIGSPVEPASSPTFVIVMAVLIWFTALGTLGFNSSCESDGCIGVVFIAAIMWAATAVQLFIAIPVRFGSRSRHHSGDKPVVAWIAASLLPPAITHLIVFWKDMWP